MKKKVLLSLLVVIGLFTITACGKKENNTTSSTSKNEFKIQDITLQFNQDTSFHNFNYKNSEELSPDESKQAVYLEYDNKEIYDGRFVFRISMGYTNDTTLEEFQKGKTTKDIKINGITWKTLTMNSTSNEKDTTSINYVTEKEDTLYVVSIVAFNEANVDIEKLAEVFINGVTLK